jgi:hypothetical protein
MFKEARRRNGMLPTAAALNALIISTGITTERLTN